MAVMSEGKAFGSTEPLLEDRQWEMKEEPDLTSCCVIVTICCTSPWILQAGVNRLQDYQASAWGGFECRH